MKILLVAFLLAIVSLQAAAVAVSDCGTATMKLQYMHADTAADLAEEAASDADADALKVSAAIDELSDYLPGALPMPSAIPAHPPSHPTERTLQSIYLPGIKPPPRG